MIRPRMGLIAVAALSLIAGLGLPARAQPGADNESRVHRLEIWNGPYRSVHFYSQGTSTGDIAALRDLERAENDLALTNEVQSLRRLYLINQRVLAQRQNEVIASWAGDYALGFAPFSYFPYGAAYGPPMPPGNEGVLWGEFARGLGQTLTPQAVANTTRAYDTAVARLADSKFGNKIGFTAGERRIGPPVTLIMKKDGEKISGNLMGEDNTWITVETAKEEVTVRKADVDRIVKTKSDVKPASR